MKIVCPTCSADYTIADDMLGPNGRKVKCATCSNIWHAQAEPETETVDAAADVADAAAADVTAPVEEGISDEQAAIDRAMAEMDFDGGFDTASEEAGEDDVAADTSSQVAIRARREEDMEPFEVEEIVASGPVDAGLDGEAGAPKNKLRVRLKGNGPSRVLAVLNKVVKIVTPVAVAAGLVGLAFAIPAREGIVRALPDTATLFAMIGLPVNVRGVEFSQFIAERSTVAGLQVLSIEGSISNVVDHSVPLTPLRLALMGAEGQELFVWRVEPDAEQLDTEQSLAIASELTAPPSNVDGVAVRFLQDGERLPGQLQ